MCQAIDNGAEVLVQVKENQAELLVNCRLLGEHLAAVQQHDDVDKGHGRVEYRRVDTFNPPTGWLPTDWEPLVKMVVRVTREVTHRRKGIPETSIETAWWVSTARLDAEQCQRAIRGHWAVENQNHYVRDVALFEDACRSREKPGVLARLRSIVLNSMRMKKISNISQALYANALNFEKAVSISRS